MRRLLVITVALLAAGALAAPTALAEDIGDSGPADVPCSNLIAVQRTSDADALTVPAGDWLLTEGRIATGTLYPGNPVDIGFLVARPAAVFGDYTVIAAADPVPYVANTTMTFLFDDVEVQSGDVLGLVMTGIGNADCATDTGDGDDVIDYNFGVGAVDEGDTVTAPIPQSTFRLPLTATIEPAVAPDADADGVSDVDDQCPDTTSGSDVDADGCVVGHPELGSFRSFRSTWHFFGCHRGTNWFCTWLIAAGYTATSGTRPAI